MIKKLKRREVRENDFSEAELVSGFHESMPRTAQVSAILMILGTLNLLLFIPMHAAGQGGPDVQRLPEALVSVGCLVLSGFLYLAGLVCTTEAVKAKQHILRSVIAMILGASVLVWWLLEAFIGP